METNRSEGTGLRRIGAVSAREASGLGTAGLRGQFLGDGLVRAGGVSLIHWETDRALVGMATPLDRPLELAGLAELRSANFLERREAGVVNIGGAGSIWLDGEEQVMARHDFLYIGAGTEEVEFRSDDAGLPAQFYFVSYPAHQRHASVHVAKAGREAEVLELGSGEGSNHRKLDRVIVPERVETCQLVMGMTFLEAGSVWNTMPPHTHERRSEVYLYFDLDPEAVVFHLMGTPEETRHLVVRDREAVFSPSWSIHAGAGTANYGFIWAMGGENQDFDDMDAVRIKDLR